MFLHDATHLHRDKVQVSLLSKYIKYLYIRNNTIYIIYYINIKHEQMKEKSFITKITFAIDISQESALFDILNTTTECEPIEG